MGTRIWAVGTSGSCELLGFLTQIACMGAMWYSCLLSFYYLLTVRYGVKRAEFRERFESWMHLSFVYFPVTGFVGYLFGWYDEQDLSMLCWAEHPAVGYVFGA